VIDERHTSRRGLLRRALRTAGLAMGARLVQPFNILAEGTSAKLGVAVIGCGGAGAPNPKLGAGERLVALCDVDDATLAKAVKEVQELGASPKTFFDYRKMLEACRHEIDVVLIATPDHHHAPAALRAMELGKHVLVQKPLAHNIRECRILTEASVRCKVHTQMGNQGHCGEGYRRLCEYIWAGAIGEVVETHSLLCRNFGGKGSRPAAEPVPAGLHWDEWLGPAPYRAYHKELHPFKWRSWRDFGAGTLGDMACHVLDGVFWALKIDQADNFSVRCLSQTPGSRELFEQNNVLRWDIPARAGMPPLKVFSYDWVDSKPELMKRLERENGRSFDGGTLYVGTKGYMYTDIYGGSVRILPESKHREFVAPEKTLPRVKGGPVMDLFRAIKEGGRPCSNFADSAGPLTEFVLTGQLAMRAGPGETVEWDVRAMRPGLKKVEPLIGRTYRPGWEV
jgi:predicted dehydrogenase